MHQELIVLCGLIIKALSLASVSTSLILYITNNLLLIISSLIIIRSIETAFVFVCIVEFKPQTKKNSWLPILMIIQYKFDAKKISISKQHTFYNKQLSLENHSILIIN